MKAKGTQPAHLTQETENRGWRQSAVHELKGTVSTLPNAKGDLYVQMGILRSLVNIKDLELLNEKDISATLGDGSSIQLWREGRQRQREAAAAD